MPNGQKLEISNYETVQLTEGLFHQQQDGDDVQMTDFSKTIPSLITESINSVDHDIRKEMYNNILTTGGTVQIKGFVERLNKDLPLIAPQNLKVKVINANGGASE